ncbi:hypothetical protein SEA_KEALII_62 [Arthrobacter phage KeAlii]|uniref:Uncharacterized protein n=1 Tax=Arthrobacter phage KeAlii TaxID=2885973 RepID=A0AA94WSM4_9CAUD|nr:hypothetical protein PQE15_gp62 [Arthrobacter phage KeAlii]UDL14668.1 hypothetical protein SEA_KEALII_62 [Arthrobacter phage KeAlii]
MNPEPPVCTCLTRMTSFGLRRLVVFDPYCQFPRHRELGTYTGPEPTYERQGG